MKLYIYERLGPFAGGAVIVAANDPGEARDLMDKYAANRGASLNQGDYRLALTIECVSGEPGVLCFYTYEE